MAAVSPALLSGGQAQQAANQRSIEVPTFVLTSIVDAHRDRNAKVLDRFAEDSLDPGFIGQNVRLVLPLKNGHERGKSGPGAFYAYDDGQLLLTMSASFERDGKENHYKAVDLRSRTLSSETYVGHNAYGATSKVSKRLIEEDAIALLNPPPGEPSEHAREYGLALDKREDFWVRLPLSGPEARKVALDTDLILEGVLARLPDATPARCNSYHSEPTLDIPIELFVQKCWIGLSAKRIALVRHSSGEVLKEWVHPDELADEISGAAPQ